MLNKTIFNIEHTISKICENLDCKILEVMLPNSISIFEIYRAKYLNQKFDIKILVIFNRKGRSNEDIEQCAKELKVQFVMTFLLQNVKYIFQNSNISVVYKIKEEDIE